ncbi:MAG: hydrolase [Thermodesulfobacteriota bacterium]|nr:hydrolase [Thermodesulfobacteriota bacterium]
MSKGTVSSKNMIEKSDSLLVVIDVQKILMPVITDNRKVIDNVGKLLKFAQIIDLPVILTEQERLGDTVPEVKQEIPECSPIEKITFDAFLCDEFLEQVYNSKRNTLILTGVETHICVSQTALHALPGFKVHVVSDAVSSRTVDNRTIGMERMRQSGAVITSTEMVIYELLQRAGTDEFRQALKLVK